MKLTEKQAAAWIELGEAILDMWMRASDLSIPNEIALDHAWLARSLKLLSTLFDRWGKTLPGVQRNSENAARRKERARAALKLMPMIFEMMAADNPNVSVKLAVDPSFLDRAGLSDADLDSLEKTVMSNSKRKPEEEPN